MFVKAGTYNEVVSVLANSQVTIIGDSSAPDDYTQNQVTISASGTIAPVSIGIATIKGITWRNINFVNTGTGNAPAITLKGINNAFYGCQFISAGATTISTSVTTAFIANSYIEGSDKLFYGYLGLYVFNSTIAATLIQSATLVYSKGTGTPDQISQSVFDSCNIVQKPGTTNTLVYLAGANGNGSQAVYKYTEMASLVAPAAVRGVGVDGFYGEYMSIGLGAYSAHSSSRLDTLMTSSMLSNCTVDYVFANTFVGYTANTSWIDSSVLEAITAANIAISSTSSTTLSVSTSSSVLSGSSSTASLLSSSLSFTTGSSTTLVPSSSTSSSAASTSPTSTCVLPSSVPSTAFVVGSAGSCAQYSSFTSAIAALPLDSSSQYVYILAGTYTEQIPSFNRTGATTFRGESTSPMDQSLNVVTLQFSGGVASNAGGSENLATFRTQGSGAGHAFYNINFVNTYPVTANYIDIAMDIKAKQVGFYSCGFQAGQGTLLVNTGTSYFSGCRIEGSSDFVWSYGGAYISNSLIVSNAPGYAVTAQSYVAGVPSQVVYDQCAFVPKTTVSMSATTYLGRDYSASARVAVLNSFLDAHIAPLGWLIKTPSTANVSFTEFNNTGPGYIAASRATQATILSDASAYSPAALFGTVNWIDSAAVVPFSGFPSSLFTSTSVTSTSTASASSSTASSSSALPASATFVVSTTPSAGQYGTVEAAISALPNDGAEKYILINPGTYVEQININRTGKVTLRGVTTFANDFSQNEVTIQFNYGVSTSASQDELTPVINSKKTDGSGLALYNINFINTFAQTSSYASLAADFYGTNMAAYGCSFIGFQDALLANKGTQLFSNCYIEGSVDFIWGYSSAYFHQCYIATNTPGATITAQSSSVSAMGGYVFDACLITYTSTYGSVMGTSYLGRPYSVFAVVIYKNSYIDKNISPAGWTVWSTSTPQTSNVTFGEYNNTGPSAWTSSTSRAAFATNLTDAQVSAYDVGTFLGGTAWIDATAYAFVPSFSFSSTGTNGTSTPTQPSSPSSTISVNGTASHPSSGTTPPDGAILVSVDGAIKDSFANLSLAVASLPADTTSQVIFLYPGSYDQHVSINRPGPVTLIGYQNGNVGQTYTGNQVTITFSRGLSVVAPVAAGHTDAETAVIATVSSRISFYNLDFVNPDNLDGSVASYVTLAASVYGDQIGFYVSHA